MRLLQAALAISLLHVGCDSSSRSKEGQDPTKRLGGVVYLSAQEPAQALGSGPFVLTDAVIEGHAFEIFTSPDTACKERNPGSLFERNDPEDKPIEAQSHHGMKLSVARGKTLCFHSSAGQSKLVWAGSPN